uniref:Uncharacterized protein n=1 Tax=Chromera velia CCMP2878 TaxID=1169474 RepID=A0A0G4FJL5_9ALVE|eukprot:Cvel_17317.t1-p1 / transcript=Cvel_17317.t1 / gene=Cvel_17317 / organism=Chromera_velia_CCMP2878 / gene_product=hypothetical protein / transcript_product=hypothetical protein / location=Cvel_scaffold1375:19030-20446(+) / protein_length=399 / sequence_SO=supercontig / SO=protein_coding / is_pseudo=false
MEGEGSPPFSPTPRRSRGRARRGAGRRSAQRERGFEAGEGLAPQVQQAGLQGRRPSPPNLEAWHLLARMGGFGGDVNRAVHSTEGNIPSREGDNNRRDRHGGESDREDEEPWTQGEPIEPNELSPRTRPPIAPSRIDPETRFAQHPHPIQRWSNPVLAVTVPQLATPGAERAPSQAAGVTRQTEREKRRIQNALLPSNHGPQRRQDVADASLASALASSSAPAPASSLTGPGPLQIANSASASALASASASSSSSSSSSMPAPSPRQNASAATLALPMPAALFLPAAAAAAAAAAPRRSPTASVVSRFLPTPLRHSIVETSLRARQQAGEGAEQRAAAGLAPGGDFSSGGHHRPGDLQDTAASRAPTDTDSNPEETQSVGVPSPQDEGMGGAEGDGMGV